MSRLLTLLLLYKNGYSVGKNISIEKQIEKTKDRYYDTLEASDAGWHNEIIKEAAVNGEEDAFSHVYIDVVKSEEVKQLVHKEEIPDELVENEETLKRVFGFFEKEVYDYLATSA